MTASGALQHMTLNSFTEDLDFFFFYWIGTWAFFWMEEVEYQCQVRGGRMFCSGLESDRWNRPLFPHPRSVCWHTVKACGNPDILHVHLAGIKLFLLPVQHQCIDSFLVAVPCKLALSGKFQWSSDNGKINLSYKKNILKVKKYLWLLKILLTTEFYIWYF